MTESVLASTSNPFNLVMDGHHISTWILHAHFFMSMAWLEGLDRLVLLLDTGSTASVRSTAAKQLGQVQKQHPDDLYHLLSRILVHLRSKSWDTRVAAGEAIHAVALSVSQWDPPSPPPSLPSHSASSAMEISSTTTDASVAAADLEELLFGFDSFDILDVLHRGAVLVASSGGEFDVDLSGMDSKERIAFQKKQLRERLGLATQFMDVSFVEESDLGAGAHTAASATTVDTKLPINQVVDASSKVKQDPDAAEAPDPYAGLSARRRNRLKRKAKLIAKSGGKDTSQIVDLSSSSLFKKRRMGEDTPVTIKAENDTVVVEHKGIDAASLGVYSSGDEWPFEGLCEQLSLDLFSPIWEIRHGAAIGLRELLKAHGTGLGRIVGLSRAANIARHRAWTEDLAIRLLCVLALDRFADFVGDQAVLPVRETCAQTLGTLMHLSDPELCLLVVNKGFVPLIGDPFGQANGQEQQRGSVSSHSSEQWEVRHSALIGLKFWMAVRKDLLNKVLVSTNSDTLLSPVYAAVLNGLKDHNDDVRAVASSALIPVSDLVVSLLPIETVFHTLVMSLWDSLHELDDLTSATSHVMDLLSNLVAIPEVATMMRLEAGNFFQSLVPQLFPFFRHAITSVRLAVLRTFSTLVGLSEQDTSATAVAWISCDLLHLVYQNFMLEENAKIVDLSLTLWTRMTRLLLKQYPAHMDSSPVYSEMTNILPNLFALLMTPIGTALDQRLLVQFTSSNPQRKTQPASPILADASLKEVKTRKKSSAATMTTTTAASSAAKLTSSRVDTLNISLQDRAMLEQDITVVSADAILYGRIAGGTALGCLLHTLSQISVVAAHTKMDELLTSYIGSAWAAHRVFGSIIVQEWAREWTLQRNTDESLLASQPLAMRLWSMLNTQLADANSGTSLLYLELVPSLSILWQECLMLFQIARNCGLGMVPPLPPLPSSSATNSSLVSKSQQYIQPSETLGSVFTLQVCDYIMQTLYPIFVQSVLDPSLLTERHSHIQTALNAFKSAQLLHETQVLAAMAGAVVSLGQLPPKLNPIIRALMNSVKTEENAQMQRRGAKSIARMIQLNMAPATATGDGTAVSGTEPSKSSTVNDKIVKNLCVFLCSDPDTVGESKLVRERDVILTLVRSAAGGAGAGGNASGSGGGAAAAGSGKSATIAGTARGKKKKAVAVGNVSDAMETSDISAASAIAEAAKTAEDAAQRHSRTIVCRGAEAALEGLCDVFGAHLFEKLPKLWDILALSLTFTQTHPFTMQSTSFELDPDDPQTQPLLDSMHILATIVKYTHSTANAALLDLISAVGRCLRASLSLARHLSAKCISSLCRVLGVEAIKVLLGEILPFCKRLD
ncbi:hypothetical protein BSLG_000562 [Batrachochytrium salamandrivorans]|nr:hypothetical protein BSLG_000562 [Batrachochytrium salamandrivorans]